MMEDAVAAAAESGAAGGAGSGQQPPRQERLAALSFRRRRAFRQHVLESSPEHRRTAPHKAELTRSLVETLFDRQCRGPRGIVRPRLPFSSSSLLVAAAPAAAAQGVAHGNRSESPSTVLDTPQKEQDEDEKEKEICSGSEVEDEEGNNSNEETEADNPALLLSPSDAAASSTIPTAHQAAAKRTKASSPAAAELHEPTSLASPCSVEHELLYWVEYQQAVRYHSAFLPHLGGIEDEFAAQQQQQQGNGNNNGNGGETGGDNNQNHRPSAPTSSAAVSTISISFSADCQTMASTHGDHTVKISCTVTGRLLRSLEGHPRTPWTCKYHPIHANILASGCLGHQVRIWNWTTAVCLQMVRLEFAIISLTFHPSGQVLAVANGTRLHFWGVPHLGKKRKAGNSASGGADEESFLAAAPSAANIAAPANGTLSEMDQRHMLRCVHFPPDGKTLIVGGVNPPSDDPRRRTRPGIGVGGSMSFYLRLWDFDLHAALNVPSPLQLQQQQQQQQLPGSLAGEQQQQQPQNLPRPITNPRTFVPRALLYNDGGFDVSPDGKVVCACVEYWLPDGVDSAMELVRKEEEVYQQERIRQEQELESLQQKQRQQQPQQPSIDETTEMTASAVAAGTTNLVDSATQDVSAMAAGATVTGTPKLPHRSTPTFSEAAPRTPEPTSNTASVLLSPPPPPGRRIIPGSGSLLQPTPSHPQQQHQHHPQYHYYQQYHQHHHHPADGQSPPPLPPGGANSSNRPPHPLSSVTASSYPETRRGRYVPHVVTLSLDTTPLDNDTLERLGHFVPRSNSNSGTTMNKTVTSAPLPAVAVGYRPRLGQLLQACPLDAGKATAVTCVKFSPSTQFCLIGLGVREPDGVPLHPVTAIFRTRPAKIESVSSVARNATPAPVLTDTANTSTGTTATNNALGAPPAPPTNAATTSSAEARTVASVAAATSTSSSAAAAAAAAGMQQISTMLSRDDDVNIARFHPTSGHGFVYGTKQGRVRIVSTRPWMFYNEDFLQEQEEEEGQDGDDAMEQEQQQQQQ